MPDSGPADPDVSPADAVGGGADGEREADPAGAFAELEAAVDRLVEAYADLRERVERAEAARRELTDALAAAGPEELDPDEAEERFRELVEENRRLREVVEAGRERAERIQSRLIMMEDEL